MASSKRIMYHDTKNYSSINNPIESKSLAKNSLKSKLLSSVLHYKTVCLSLVAIIILCVVINISDPTTTIHNNHFWTSSTDICIWNAVNSSFVNGLWTTSAISRSENSYFTLSVDASCNQNTRLFLYKREESIWTIAPDLDEQYEFEYIGECKSDIVPRPDECEKRWQIPYGSTQPSVTVTVTDVCPEMKCEVLNVDYDKWLKTENCQGQFNKVGTNLFLHDLYDMYLYFNPSMFRWICGTTVAIPNKCYPLAGYYSYAIKQSWYNADNLIETADEIEIPWSNGHTAVIICKKGISSSSDPRDPTKAPTDGVCYLGSKVAVLIIAVHLLYTAFIY